ncbi:Uncharacterised protein [Serratia liquefaciens]|nr:Uncharacterised protein [Serratia liquefaciens]
MQLQVTRTGDKTGLVIHGTAGDRQFAQAADTAILAAVAIAQRLTVGIDARIAARLQQSTVVGQCQAVDIQLLLADQSALAVIKLGGEQIGRPGTHQHPLAVVQRAAVDRQRPLAEDAAGFTAQAVAQRRALGVDIHIAGGLQQASVIVQHTAAQAQISAGGDNALLVVQRPFAQRQRKRAAHDLPGLILQPGTGQLQSLFGLNTAAAVIQRLSRRNLSIARRGGNQPLAVIQLVRPQLSMAAGRQLSLSVIDSAADLCLQAAVLRSNHFAALVVQPRGVKRDVAVSRQLAALVINPLAGIKAHLTLAALHQLAVAVRQTAGIQRDLLCRSRAAVQYVVAALHAELAVGQQLATIALQATGIHRQRTFTGMDDLPALVVDQTRFQRQVIAVAGNTATGVIQFALWVQPEVVFAKLGDLPLAVG